MASHAELPRYAGVVVVGGGIVGCSLAYHLAKLGAGDVALIERDSLTSGTTWHAAGVVGSLRASVFLTKLTVDACQLFASLEAETGQATGYRRTGGLSIAQTKERLEELKRVPAIAALTGIEGELLTPAEVREKSPILEVSDLTRRCLDPVGWSDQSHRYHHGARQRRAYARRQALRAHLYDRARAPQSLGNNRVHRPG